MLCTEEELAHSQSEYGPKVKSLNAKLSSTHFQLEWYDERSKTSLVKCYPKTGRTH